MRSTARNLSTIRGYMTDVVIDAIAHEYAINDRKPFVATTNLDVPARVLGKIGALAAIASPRTAERVARILLAPASIPGAFPPMVAIEVAKSSFGVRADPLISLKSRTFRPQAVLFRPFRLPLVSFACFRCAGSPAW